MVTVALTQQLMRRIPTCMITRVFMFWIVLMIVSKLAVNLPSFILMPHPQPDCVICTKRINTKAEQRPITYIKSDEIYCELKAREDATSLRVHRPCAMYPHKHSKMKVGTWTCHEQLAYMLDIGSNAISRAFMSHGICMCRVSKHVFTYVLRMYMCLYDLGKRSTAIW